MLRILPNILTAFRALASVLIPVLIFWGGDSGRLIGFILFVMAAFSDWLDGAAARRLDAISTFGRMLDPIADKLLIAGCLMALAARDDWGGVLFIPALIILLREVFVSGLREFMAGTITLHVTMMAKAKTTAQMAALGLAMLAPLTPHGWGIETLTITAFWLAAGMTVWTGWGYLAAVTRHTAGMRHTPGMRHHDHDQSSD